MNSILEDLFYGKIPSYECVVPKDPKYLRIQQTISEELFLLKSKLSPDEFDTVELLLTLRGIASSFESEQGFYDGYRLGARFMVEVFRDKETPTVKATQKIQAAFCTGFFSSRAADTTIVHCYLFIVN